MLQQHYKDLCSQSTHDGVKRPDLGYETFLKRYSII